MIEMVHSDGTPCPSHCDDESIAHFAKDTDRRMRTGDGRIVVPDSEAEASWLAIENQAIPMDFSHFPWDRVLALAGPRTIDPAVYRPGSVL